MVGRVIKVASTLKGKYKLVLKEDDYIVSGHKLGYSIVDLENGSSRGSFDVGDDKEEALSKLKEMVAQWNELNINLGKLRLI